MIKALLTIITVSGCFAIGHYLVLMSLIQASLQDYPYWLIYVFFVPITFLGYLYIENRVKKNPRSGAKSFIIYTVLKIIAIVAFLSPWFIYKTEFTRPFVLQFMALFFVLLITETALFVRVINKASEKV